MLRIAMTDTPIGLSHPSALTPLYHNIKGASRLKNPPGFHLGGKQWSQQDSNLWPHRCERCALPTEPCDHDNIVPWNRENRAAIFIAERSTDSSVRKMRETAKILWSIRVPIRGVIRHVLWAVCPTNWAMRPNIKFFRTFFVVLGKSFGYLPEGRCERFASDSFTSTWPLSNNPTTWDYQLSHATLCVSVFKTRQQNWL